MREELYTLFANPSDLTWEQILWNITMSALFGFLIFLSYYISHRGTIYSKKFNASLVLLTILTGTVMTVIGNNLALSLGMVGALSIVRFRTAIKDSRDTVYIFWAIIVGICCGVGDYLVAAIGSSAVFAALLVFGCIKSDCRMLFIIRADRERSSMIKAKANQLFGGKASLRVENTTETQVELIYELTQKLLKRAEKKEPEFIDSFYRLGNISYVNLVMQNDEISN